jgi:protein TonB
VNTPNAARRLRPFLAGSIVLHLTLFASAAAMRLDWSGMSAIAVELEAGVPLEVSVDAGLAEGVSRARPLRPSPRLTPSAPGVESAGTTSELEPVEISPALATEMREGNAAQAVAGGDRPMQPAAASAELRGAIETALARYFTYPPLARREGREGIVQLRFNVAGDGAIENIAVASSSGHVLLDRAAQSSLAQAARVSVPPALAGRTHTVDLPVRYRLVGER